MPDPDTRQNVGGSIGPGQAPEGPYDYWSTSQLASGEAVFPRQLAVSGAVGQGSSGALRLAYFTARKTEPITQVRLYSGATPMGATPTLVRAGVWTVDTDGVALTALVASIANDTALFGTASTRYTRSLQATWNKVAGTRYALGIIVVTAAAIGNYAGISGALPVTEFGLGPRISGFVNGQADLPATVAAGSVNDTVNVPFGAFLP